MGLGLICRIYGFQGLGLVVFPAFDGVGFLLEGYRADMSWGQFRACTSGSRV